MLQPKDRNILLQMLTSLPILAYERGREAVLVGANLDQLRPQLDLSGPPAVAVPLMISFLETYGLVSYDHHALGLLLNALKGYTGLEEATFLDQIIQRYSLMVPGARSPVALDWSVSTTTEGVLEKIIGENTLRPIAFLQQGLTAARAVTYIEVQAGSKRWSGTGFLLSERLLLTNHHVLPERDLLDGTLFRFNYQHDSAGTPEPFQDYHAAPGGVFLKSQALDFALVELEGNPGLEWKCLRIRPQIPSVDSRVNIIQHPNGLPKQVAMQNNFVKYADANRVQYVTSTLPGSSGSPVFNDQWEVIALHHAGGWLPEAENTLVYFRNEGIAIQAILENLPPEICKQFTMP